MARALASTLGLRYYAVLARRELESLYAGLRGAGRDPVPARGFLDQAIPYDEYRAHWRLPLAIPCTLIVDDVSVDAWTVNVSLGGLLAVSEREFTPGATCTVRFRHARRGLNFDLPAEVVRVSAAPPNLLKVLPRSDRAVGLKFVLPGHARSRQLLLS